MDTFLKIAIWALYVIAPLGAVAAVVVAVGLVRAHLAQRGGDA